MEPPAAAKMGTTTADLLAVHAPQAVWPAPQRQSALAVQPSSTSRLEPVRPALATARPARRDRIAPFVIPDSPWMPPMLVEIVHPLA